MSEIATTVASARAPSYKSSRTIPKSPPPTDAGRDTPAPLRQDIASPADAARIPCDADCPEYRNKSFQKHFAADLSAGERYRKIVFAIQIPHQRASSDATLPRCVCEGTSWHCAGRCPPGAPSRSDAHG